MVMRLLIGLLILLVVFLLVSVFFPHILEEIGTDGTGHSRAYCSKSSCSGGMTGPAGCRTTNKRCA